MASSSTRSPSAAATGERRPPASTDGTAVTFTDGVSKPKPDVEFIDNRGFATDESAWEDGTVKLTVETNQMSNQLQHNTDPYAHEVEQLVVRRGQPFVLSVKVKGRRFDKERDGLKMIFSTGKGALESKGTAVNLVVYNSLDRTPDGNRWIAYIDDVTDDGKSGSTVRVSVTSSSDALVGTYKLIVKLYAVDDAGHERMFMKRIQEPIYMLFNPWNKDDQVYMDDMQERSEYVLNETGRVYQMGWGGPYGKPWNFAQFDKHCLEAAVYVLDNSYLSKQKHGNATLVTRALTCMANSCNWGMPGILTGNWSGDYAGGKSPSSWNGSSAILEQYMKTKEAVCYGQCWVFSGLVTTLCRTLGIPARSVTNFGSAHDTDASMTIDKYFNEELEPIEGMNSDSVWNFHVWNEGWFRRPDLPRGYDGWQAFDGTPQEESESLMQCGPAPVKAIQEGNVYLGYDAKFIFAEVNGDRIGWMVKENGDMEILKEKCDLRSVGKDISTKAVGSTRRNDVTRDYKFREGSEEERASVARAQDFANISWSLRDRKRKMEAGLEEYYKQGVDDVTIESEAECLDNGDIRLKFTAENKSGENRELVYKVRTSAVYYTGVVGNNLNTKRENMTLDAGELRQVSLTLPAEGYLNVLKSDAYAKVFVSARVKQTKQFFLMEKTLQVNKPDLEFKLAKDTVAAGEPLDLDLSFSNPLDCKLTEVVIRLEGPGIQKDMQIVVGEIKAGATHVEKVTLTPKHPGKREIIACLNSKQITNVNGVTAVQITAE